MMVPVFPTSYSTLQADALASFVSEQYNLGPVQGKFLTRGVGDTYLIVAPSSPYILRVYRASHRNYTQVKAEIDLLLALKNAEVSVSYPISDKQGQTIQTLSAAEGNRCAVLFSYAPGRMVPLLTEKQLHLLGQEMAKFHSVSSLVPLNEARWLLDVETTLTQPLQAIKDFFLEDPEEYAWLQEAAAIARARLAQFNTSAFSFGYCHYDFFPKNFHFDGDEKLTLFDFDFLGRGWLVNDVMVFWQHLCLDVHYGKMKQESADHAFQIFLSGYRAVRPLSEEELAAMPYLALGFWVFYLGFYATHDHFLPLLQNPRLKARVQLIRQITERYWEKAS
ncbi:phosphotransferase enzyme family protein [Rufibacter hautae]|uniref:Phosphotransferase n=1 Tax=Rufibacter hautae TaxID=2595005 RepID=A0A5B6TCC4_9BACT|nr:phosphotransferase [Rufibacter hautae]KAA3436674.1 phosphotransferase [Rufibacter hautae]